MKTSITIMFLLAIFFIGFMVVITVQAFIEQEQHNKNVIENITTETIFSDEIDIPQPPEAGSSATTMLYFTVLPAD